MTRVDRRSVDAVIVGVIPSPDGMLAMGLLLGTHPGTPRSRAARIEGRGAQVEPRDLRRDPVRAAGSELARARVRVAGPIGSRVVLSGYISHRNASPSEVARHPVAVLAAERRLRRMAAERPRAPAPAPGGVAAEPGRPRAAPARRARSSRLRLRRRPAVGLRSRGPPAGGSRRRHRRRWRRCRPRTAWSPATRCWPSGRSQHNRDVVMIPSCVDARLATVERPTTPLGDPPRLGWIGSADNETYLRIDGARAAGGPPPNRRAAHPDRHDAARALGDLEGFIDRVAWSEATQHALLARARRRPRARCRTSPTRAASAATSSCSTRPPARRRWPARSA